VIQAAQKIAAHNPTHAALAESLVVKYERKLADHRVFIEQHGIDPPEITDWRWSVS
jgi:xylulose-5-phosphate/fructose-6-phosphate phosphoketolase